MDQTCLNGYIMPKLENWAATRAASGIGPSLRDVLDHYLGDATFHGSVDGRPRFLVWVSDGFNMGEFEPLSPEIRRLRLANVYLGSACPTASDPSYSGVEGYVESAEAGGLYDGQLVAAGENLFNVSNNPVVKPPTQFQAVIDGMTGVCFNLDTPESPDHYLTVVQRPIIVSGAASRLTQYFDQHYSPFVKLESQINQRLDGTLTPPTSPARPRLPTASGDRGKYSLILFPMPITDLDETKILSARYSDRDFDLNYLAAEGAAELMSSHQHLMPRIRATTGGFNRGVSTLGVTLPINSGQ